MAGKRGFGAKIAYRVSTGPDVYTDFAQVTKITPFSAKADVLDVSDFDSPGGYREKVGGMLDNGQCQLTLNYDDKNATHVYMLAQLGIAQVLRITFPAPLPSGTSSKAIFSGFISQLGAEIPADNKMSATATLEITGTIAWS